MDRRFWYLVLEFAMKDFKIRYTHSVLGYAWSILNPLIFSVLYYFVFSVFLRFDVPNYPGYLLLGIILWTFFSEGSSNGIASLLGRAGIITKVALPREVVVFAAILNAFITLSISLFILSAMLWLVGTPFSWTVLTMPVTIIDLVLITTGISLLLAPLQVRYHDIGYLWGVAVQIGFWLTPIIYLDSFVPPRWHWLFIYNPMARIVTQGREALVYRSWPGGLAMLQTSAFALVLLLVGWWVFRRMQPRLLEYY